jgi:arginyl-tRNA synthetase
MSITLKIKEAANLAIKNLYQLDIPAASILVNNTNTEFEGDYTIVLFAFIKQLKKSPEVLGNEMGAYLMQYNTSLFSSFNIIKGFLNLTITDNYWIDFLQQNHDNNKFGLKENTSKNVMVEYSSPNTNKPLHLGHLRNNFLGWSVAEIYKASGYNTIKTCIVNDRGVHICKSMIAWQLFANGATPQSTNTKGDHFVGDYYVKFNDAYKAEIEQLIASGKTKEEAEKQAPIMLQTQQMLLDWEAGNPAVMELWKEMNGWVYEGFDITYKTIGSDFDKIYYESNTYLLGKKIIAEGLTKSVFTQEEDNSVWIDLTNDGLDKKIVQRKDGTSVYITQDIGLAEQKFDEYGSDKSIYVIGDEQNYHMKVLKLICQKLQLPSADGIEHLSYGMVELPTGKMKSREGTVVDADDIVTEMISISKERTEALGKVKDFTTVELQQLYTTIGLGALKFFLLRVDPKKKMIFNPEESIDFHGFTGPFVQYTYARIKSVLRKLMGNGEWKMKQETLLSIEHPLFSLEKNVAIMLEQFPTIIEEAANENDPSKIAIYVFNVAKTFNSFYVEHSIANAEIEEKKILRIQLAQMTASTIKTGMRLLGIDVPERM